MPVTTENRARCLSSIAAGSLDTFVPSTRATRLGFSGQQRLLHGFALVSSEEQGKMGKNTNNWKFLHRRVIFGPKSDPGPIICRWTLIETPLFGVKVHHVMRSDPPERGFHDHPWSFISLRLAARYTEHILRSDGTIRQESRRVSVRRANVPHRLELPAGARCWTIFLTGPRTNSWRVIPPVENKSQ
jgi:hypothetical protein